jgi:serine/threonine protein kinase
MSSLLLPPRPANEEKVWKHCTGLQKGVFAFGFSMSMVGTRCESASDDASIERGLSPGMDEFEATYEILGHLGEGSTSTVMLARDRFTAELVAVKQIDHARVSVDEIEREIYVMEELNKDSEDGDQSYIVRLVDVFRSVSFTYIVMELVPGCDLFHALTKAGVACKNFSKRDTVMRYARQLVHAIRYIHTKGLLHMDLKPSNILLRRNTDPEGLGSIRLTDFGSAIADDGDRKESFAKRNTRRAQGRINLHSFSSGTTAYWPPETIIFKDHSKATDMWALGCIIYILVTGKHPFDRNCSGIIEMIETNVLSEDVEFLDHEWEGMNDLKEIVQMLLCKDKHHRMTEEALCNHELFR